MADNVGGIQSPAENQDAMYISESDFEDSSSEYIPECSRSRSISSLSDIGQENNMNTNNSLVPYSSTESDCEDQQQSGLATAVKTRKRKRNLHAWKKNVRKMNRVRGKQYVSSTGKVMTCKKLKEPCKDSCRHKCSIHFSTEMRQRIFDEFWTGNSSWDQKNQYIASCMTIDSVKRSRAKDGSKNRNKTILYKIKNNGIDLRVCKPFFLNTFNVGESYIKSLITKLQPSGLIQPDQRGKHSPINKTSCSIVDTIKKHIEKFPAYESHYSRERTAKKYLGSELNIKKMYNLYVEECTTNQAPISKEWHYRKIFNENFNLSFHSPDNDTCDMCDSFLNDLKASHTEDEKRVIEDQRKQHIDDATKRYHLKAEDKKLAIVNSSIVVMADLQKCLPTPYLTNSQSFYLRKLWTFNYTVYDSTNKKTCCMMWDEIQGGRGGNEMASCFLKFVQETITANTKSITVWTDNCPGQNRNIMMVMMLFILMNKYPSLETINHKFLLRGHTHMEVDASHSIIERRKKCLKTMSIFTCNDWCNFVRSCGQSFNVYPMTLSSFFSFSSLFENNGPFVNRKKSEDGTPASISAMVWMQVRRGEYGKLFYKTSFEDGDFSVVDLRRNKRRPAEVPPTLPQLRAHKNPISKKKYEDIVTMLQWVPEEYKDYFRSIPFKDDNIDDS